MFDRQDRVIHYKWSPTTETGYRLRFDPQDAQQGVPYCYHVEDWSDHIVTNEWNCASLDEALSVLTHLFDLDQTRERDRLEKRFLVA